MTTQRVAKSPLMNWCGSFAAIVAEEALLRAMWEVG